MCYFTIGEQVIFPKDGEFYSGKIVGMSNESLRIRPSDKRLKISTDYEEEDMFEELIANTLEYERKTAGIIRVPTGIFETSDARMRLESLLNNCSCEEITTLILSKIDEIILNYRQT